MKSGLIFLLVIGFTLGCADVHFQSENQKEKKHGDDDNFGRGLAPFTQAAGGLVQVIELPSQSVYKDMVVIESLIGQPLKPMADEKNGVSVEVGYIYVQGEFIRR